jgi:hypothetical protein
MENVRDRKIARIPGRLPALNEGKAVPSGLQALNRAASPAEIYFGPGVFIKLFGKGGELPGSRTTRALEKATRFEAGDANGPAVRRYQKLCEQSRRGEGSTVEKSVGSLARKLYQGLDGRALAQDAMLLLTSQPFCLELALGAWAAMRTCLGANERLTLAGHVFGSLDVDTDRTELALFINELFPYGQRLPSAQKKDVLVDAAFDQLVKFMVRCASRPALNDAPAPLSPAFDQVLRVFVYWGFKDDARWVRRLCSNADLLGASALVQSQVQMVVLSAVQLRQDELVAQLDAMPGPEEQPARMRALALRAGVHAWFLSRHTLPASLAEEVDALLGLPASGPLTRSEMSAREVRLLGLCARSAYQAAGDAVFVKMVLRLGAELPTGALAAQAMELRSTVLAQVLFDNQTGRAAARAFLVDAPGGEAPGDEAPGDEAPGSSWLALRLLTWSKLAHLLPDESARSLQYAFWLDRVGAVAGAQQSGLPGVLFKAFYGDHYWEEGAARLGGVDTLRCWLQVHRQVAWEAARVQLVLDQVLGFLKGLAISSEEKIQLLLTLMRKTAGKATPAVFNTARDVLLAWCGVQSLAPLVCPSPDSAAERNTWMPDGKACLDALGPLVADLLREVNAVTERPRAIRDLFAAIQTACGKEHPALFTKDFLDDQVKFLKTCLFPKEDGVTPFKSPEAWLVETLQPFYKLPVFAVATRENKNNGGGSGNRTGTDAITTGSIITGSITTAPTVASLSGKKSLSSGLRRLSMLSLSTAPPKIAAGQSVRLRNGAMVTVLSIDTRQQTAQVLQAEGAHGLVVQVPTLPWSAFPD